MCSNFVASCHPYALRFRFVGTTLSVIALIVAVVGTSISWRVAHRAQRTADSVLSIEADRRHDELDPDFAFTVTLTGNPGQNEAWLDVKYVKGPKQLDAVTIRILDEAGTDHWARGLPDGVTQEVADEFIWGPWEFNTGARDQVAGFRTTKPRPYSLTDGGDWDKLLLVRTRAGAWMSTPAAQSWDQDHSGPIRLQLACVADGYQPWIVVREIEWRKRRGLLS